MARTVWYSPTTWVEKITRLGPTNLNKSETGISNAHTRIDRLAFFVADYGADKTGVTDSTAAIQAAVTACITAGGGVVVFEAGTYKISGTIDFSALSGTRTQLTAVGAGTGGWASGSPAAASTIIKQTAAACALKAYASSTSSGIYGLRFEKFSVYCTVALGAGVYGIDWNGVASMGGMRDVFVQGPGSGTSGGGVRVANPFNGQFHFENVIGSDFTNGDGFRLSVETLGGVTAVNSGNVTLTNVAGFSCYNGIHLTASGNALDGVTLNSPKGYGSANYDILLDGSYVGATVLNAPHCEGAVSGGIKIGSGAQGTIINGGLFTGGTNGDGLSCIYVQGGRTVINGPLLQNHQYGVTFDGVGGCFATAGSTANFSTPAVATMFHEINGAVGNTKQNMTAQDGFWVSPGLVLTDTLWLRAGSGVPATGLGVQGDFYFRYDGGAGTHLYFKSGVSTWTAIA